MTFIRCSPLLLLAAAGCSAPGAFTPPPPALDAALAERISAAPGAGLAAPAPEVDEAWWRVYGDEQLDRLVARAFDNNRDLMRSALAVRRAVIQAYLLGVDLRPRFSAGLDQSMSRNLGDGGPSRQQYGADLGVSYEVDLWRRRRDVRDAQVWETRATAEDLAAARLSLANSVVDAYYHLAYLLDAMAAVLDSMANYEEIEAKTRIKFEEGKVAAVEPTQARQSWLAANATLIDLQAQRKAVEQTLRNLLHLAPDEPLDCVPPSLVDFEPPPPELDVPLSALSNRPDLRAAEHRLREAYLALGVAHKGWYPSLTLGATLASSRERLTGMFETPVAGSSVSINLPFLQPRTVRGGIWLAEADREGARADFEEAIVTALNEVDAYHFAHQKALETLANSREKYAIDLKVGEHYRARYEEGSGELLDWLDAQNTITNARLSTVQCRYQAMRQENLLYRAMAGRYRKSPPGAAD